MRSDAERTVRVGIEGFGGGRPGAVRPFPLNPTLNTGWTQVSQSFTLPADFPAPSLCIRFQNPGGGQVWVEDVRLAAGDGKEAPLLQDKIAVGPRTAPVGGLYFAGKPAPLVLDVVNTDDQAHQVAVRTYVTDWEHEESPATEVGTVEAPARSIKELTYPLDTGRRGTFRLGFELSADGQSWRQSTEFKYAVVVPLEGVGDAGTLIFAMNTHMDREPTQHLQRSMEVLSECGVKWIRAWWGWGDVREDPGTVRLDGIRTAVRRRVGREDASDALPPAILSEPGAGLGRLPSYDPAAAGAEHDGRVGQVRRGGGPEFCGQSRAYESGTNRPWGTTGAPSRPRSTPKSSRRPRQPFAGPTRKPRLSALPE